MHKLRKKVRKPKKLARFLEEHPIPGVLGPGDVFYMVDHHHLAWCVCLCAQALARASACVCVCVFMCLCVCGGGTLV